jgi:gliding motility-associated-like protein
MKTIFKLLSAVAFLLGAENFLWAQDGKVRYRITAYKYGDNRIVSQSNIVEINPPVELYVPNAFTPNGDGLNDFFGAKGEGITDFEMLIFNRWGELIFESHDIKKTWDGTYKGESCQEGVFAYTITAQGEKTKEIRKGGTVTLVK